MQLQLVTGFNGALLAAPHPSQVDSIVYSTGANIIVEEVNSGVQRLLRADGRISAFSLSPLTGRFAATGTKEPADVILWDFESGARLTTFQEHDVEVAQLAFSSDERLLMTIGCEKDCRVFILDTATGKIVTKNHLPPRERATAAAFGPVEANFYTYAACTLNGEVHIWTLDPFTGVSSATKAVASGSLRRSFTCLKFSPDGQWLYCGTASGDIVTINVARRSMQMSHPCCSSGVGYINFTLDYSKLIVGGGDGSLSLFANDNGDVTPFAKVPGSITSLTPSPDGSSLIIGTLHGGIHRLPAGSTTSFPLRRSPGGAVRGLAVADGDPSRLFTCGDDGVVSSWSLASGPLTPPGLLLGQSKATDTKTIYSAQSIALTATEIFSGWSDGSIRCHNRLDNSPAPYWSIANAHALSNSTGVTALKTAHRHPLVISGGAGGEIRAWDTKTRTVTSMMKKHTGPIVDLVVLNDDTHLVAASQDKSWSLWDIKNARIRASWMSNTVLNGIDVCPDQMTVVTVGQDRRIVLWDIRSPDAIRVLFSPTAQSDPQLTCVTVDPTGSAVAVGGADGSVSLFDLSTGQKIASSYVHTAAVSKVVFPAKFDPAQTWQPLASVSVDGSVAYWQV